MRIFIRSGNILNRKQLFRFDTVYSQKHDRVIIYDILSEILFYNKINIAKYLLEL